MRRKRRRDAQMRPRRRLFLESLENRRLLVATDLASVSGLVFDDFSGNGYDAGEEVASASLSLYRDNGDGVFQQGADQLVTSTTTGVDGRYSFNRVSAGDYFVFQGAQTVSGSTLTQMVSPLSTFSADAVAGTIVTAIDTFNQTTQQVTDTTNDGVPVTSSASAPEAIGGERDLYVNLTSNTGLIQLSVNDTTLGLPGLLMFGSTGQGDGERRVSWDGFDNDAAVIDDTGLGAVDLTGGGEALGLQLQVGADLAGSEAVVRLYSNDGVVGVANRYSSATLSIPQTDGNVSQKEFLPFSSFAASSGGAADFTKVGAIELEITGTANIDGQADIVGTVGETGITQDFANFSQADLSLGKTVDNASPNISEIVNFTITVTNNGPDAATNVAVSDQLPDGVTFVNSVTSQGSYSTSTGIWTVGTVTSGITPQLVLSGRVVSAGSRVNFAEVSASDQFDPNSTPGNGPQAGENDQASVSFVTESIDLSLVKTADPTLVIVGNNVTYQLVVSNEGPSTATGVEVKDELPLGIAFANASATQGEYSVGTGVWNVGAISPGSNQSLTLVGTVETPGDKVNTAEVIAADQVDIDSTPNNGIETEDDQSSVTIQAPEADLSLLMTVSKNSPTVGEEISFELKLSNAGRNPATGVLVKDLLPVGLEYVSSSATSGQYDDGTGIWNVGALSVNANVTLTINARATTANTLINTAEVFASDQWDPNSTPNNGVPSEDDQASQTIGATQIDLSLVKRVDDATPNLNDTVTFTVIVNNDGPSDATGVEVRDILPSGLSFVGFTASTGTYNSSTGQWIVGTISNQASEQLEVQARVIDVVTVINTAEVMKADQEDLDSTPGNGIESEDDQDSISVTPQQADLELSKSVDNEQANVGQDVTFTVVVRNQGPNAATNVIVTDKLPDGITYKSGSTPPGSSYNAGSGVWDVGTIPAESQVTLTVVGGIDGPGTKINTAQVSSVDQYDPDSTPGNGVESEDDQQSVSITPPIIDVSLIKDIDIARPIRGQTIRYTVRVSNEGPNDATNLIVKDELPDGLNFVTSSTVSGNYNLSSGEWSVGTLSSGALATLEIDAVVDTIQSTTNIAQVWSVDQYDSDSTPGNSVPTEDDYDSATFELATADLSVTKSVDNPKPNVGDPVHFTITVTNGGEDSATGVTLLDVLPEGLAYERSVAGVGAYDAVSGIWDVGGLAVQQTATLTITANSTNDTPLTNIVQVQTLDQLDPDATPGNGVPSEDDQASVDVVGQQIDLSLTKTVDNDRPNVGDLVHFTVSLTNSRATEATGVTVKDPLPVGLVYRASIASRGSYNGSSGVWTVGQVANGEVETLTITAEVTATGTLENIAEVLTANQPDIDSTPNNNDPNEDDQASATVTPQVADLTLGKLVDDERPDVGQVSVFTITVTNLGPDAATGVSVADQLPDGLAYSAAQPSRGTFDSQQGIWTIGQIDANEVVTLQLGAQVENIGVKINSAEIATSDQSDPNSTPGNNVPEENDQASASVRPTIIDLSLEKEADPFRPSVNGELTYTLTVSNAGPDTATGIQIEDQFPSGVTVASSEPSVGTFSNGIWSVPTLAPQTNATLKLVTDVNLPGTWTNRAEVIAADQYDFDSTPGNDDGIDGNGNDEDDQASITNTTASADLSVSKSVSDDHPGILSEVVYTVLLNNSGPDEALDVQVLDQIPAGLTFVSYEASTGTYNSSGNGIWRVPSIGEGGQEKLDITVAVSTLGEKINTAEVIASSQYDPNSTPGNNDPTEDDQDSVSLTPQLVDLALTKMVDDPTPNLGDNVTFTLELTNQGPSTATGVVVRDILADGFFVLEITPSQGVYDPTLGLWKVGEIRVGTIPSLMIEARVDVPEPLVNVAEVVLQDQPDIDSTPNNGVPTEDDYSAVTVTPQIADLRMVMDVSDETPNQQEELFYTLIVYNDGPNHATNVMVRSILPDGLEFLRVANGDGIYNEFLGLWEIPRIDSGTAAAMQLVVTVDSKVPITSTAEVIASDQYDANSTPDNGDVLENDYSMVTVTPKLIDVSVSATVNNAMPALGDVVEMTFTVANDGPATATGVTAAIVIPPELELVRVIPRRGTYGLPGSEETWLIGSIDAGAKVTLVIQARPLRRGAAVVEMEVMSYDQADVESDPGNNVVTENDQTQLVVSVPLYSKRMFMASSQQVNAPTRTVRNLRFAR
ncbi:hypothetical protein OAG60_01985 [bacterium]|nr:hypothetical protein [bacterium]